MAYQPVKDGNNQNTVWEYDDSAQTSDAYTSGNNLSQAPGVDASGIRTFTWANGNTQQTYIKCRKVGETIVRGGISKDYYDAH